MQTLKQLQVELFAAKAEIARPQQQNASSSGFLCHWTATQAAAARTFSPPSADQGLKYLYVPVQCRILISQLRSRLRRLPYQ
jgi:hypothetical protein